MAPKNRKKKKKEKVETPRTQTKSLLRGLHITMKTNEDKKREQNVTRTLLFHCCNERSTLIESDRETCACKLHENTQLMADA